MTGGLDHRADPCAIVRELSHPAAPHAVYLARDTVGDSVVLKSLGDTYRAREDLALRLRLEADVLREVGGSCGVVRLIRSWEAPLTLVMEYVGGGSLADRLGDARSLGIAMPQPRARCVANGLLRALHHVHSRGVVHRDVKPSNVLFTQDGTVRLIDFGVAARRDPARGGAYYGLPADWIEERVGTLPYAAPESVLDPGGGATPASDIYSAAVVIVEMLTGAPPWSVREGESPEAFAERISRIGSGRVVGSATSLPPDVADALVAALDTDPRLRIASAAELAGAISRV